MKYSEIINEGRRLKTTEGIFLLNPSKQEFDGYFRDKFGAAFYLDIDGQVSFGAGNTSSIDHSTIAKAFSLGAEAARGFISADHNGQIEVWASNSETMIDMTTDDKAKISKNIKAVEMNSCLNRISTNWKIIVFNCDYVEIEDSELKPFG